MKGEFGRWWDHVEEFVAAGVRLIEMDGAAVEFEVSTPKGIVAIITHVIRIDDRLVFDRLHMSGEGLTIGVIRAVAKLFGRVEDVVEVMIQGGDRSSGANRGSNPRPVGVQVN